MGLDTLLKKRLIEMFWIYKPNTALGSLNDIKSGDLIMWSENNESFKSKFFINLVKFVTRSPYGHVGVAMRQGTELYVVEATFPKIRKIKLSERTPFYYVNMGIRWNAKHSNWLNNRIGMHYSLLDGIRSFFGVPAVNDDDYQCAEMVADFYRLEKFDPGNQYLPSFVIRRLLEDDRVSGNSIHHVD